MVSSKPHDPNGPRDSRQYSAESKVLEFFFLFLANAQRLQISTFVKITRIYVFNSNFVIFVSLICTFTAKRARLYMYGRDLGVSQNSQGLVEFHSTVATVISQIPGGTAILGRNFSQGSDTDTYPYTRRGR